MSDVYIAFGTLLSLGIVFPGLLMTWWLIFPKRVNRAKAELAQRPLRTFVIGFVMVGVIGLPTMLLLAISLPFTSFLGAAVIIAALAFSLIGAAGLTSWMADRLASRSSGQMSESASFLRSAVVLELGAAFPILGWFLFIPLCIIACLGAATMAFLGRRTVQTAEEPRQTGLPTIQIQTTGATDVS